MSALPKVMVAPNGARHTKADHPALPVTLAESIEAAKTCFAAGADGLHLHLRDKDGQHLLDHGLYREAVQELAQTIPKMTVQITTEAVGIYKPTAQMEVALKSGAELVSASVRELTTGQNPKDTKAFYQNAADQGIHIQHILYDLSDLLTLKSVLPKPLFAANNLQLLFVLGRYGAPDSSRPKMLDPYLHQMQQDNISPDWATCAFGTAETACLLYTHQKGGKIRVGFENSFWNDDKTLAKDNAERVRSVISALQ